MKYRNNGATGALLDLYEKAITDLIHTIKDISTEELNEVLDTETTDEDCRSIQSVLSHVVQSGYTYVVEIRKHLGEEIEYTEKVTLRSSAEYILALKNMFAFQEVLFEDHPNLKLCELDSKKKITVRWGQTYDVEQLLQHAILHIMRHTRQIERFKTKF